MSPPDRKVVHDTVNEIDGVHTMSEGEDSVGGSSSCRTRDRGATTAPSDRVTTGGRRPRFRGRRGPSSAPWLGRRPSTFQRLRPTSVGPAAGLSPGPRRCTMGEAALLEQLERARALGFLGPGPVTSHVAHAPGVHRRRCASATVGWSIWAAAGECRGWWSALARPDLEVVLVDAMAKRCRFLESAVAALGISVTVVEGRAEVVGRGPLRGSADAVLARSFGPPAVTAECAAPLLRVGGVLIVSEPPEATDRWPAARSPSSGCVVQSRTWRHAGPPGARAAHAGVRSLPPPRRDARQAPAVLTASCSTWNSRRLARG